MICHMPHNADQLFRILPRAVDEFGKAATGRPAMIDPGAADIRHLPAQSRRLDQRLRQRKLPCRRLRNQFLYCFVHFSALHFITKSMWCPERGSNPYFQRKADFKSAASAIPPPGHSTSSKI